MTRRVAVESPRTSARQVAITRAVVRWYLRLYFGTAEDMGTTATFTDPARVGAFAVDRRELARGESASLFRVLVTTAMFQRRQDVQILHILQGISPDDAGELTDAGTLLALADGCQCPIPRANATLIPACDLTKNPRTRRGECAANPKVACHLKRHTELLKRYGHFGKVPTSIALSVRDAGASDLGTLRARVFAQHRTRGARAAALEQALCAAWRVNQKIAAMFLSLVSNPDLLPDAAWQHGIDWRRFVVVDSNVDHFLRAIAYRGTGTYDARREFVVALAKKVPIHLAGHRLRRNNPRLVQQAMYLFMSVTNRRAVARDCSHLGVAACRACPKLLSRVCPVRRDA